MRVTRENLPARARRPGCAPRQCLRRVVSRMHFKWVPVLALSLPGFMPLAAHASFLQGETLDTAANVIAWIVLIVVPIVAIGAFWMVHILPEKIAEKRKHPQAKAIQVLCLLSLAFGGLLWPLAFLWAYSKPVLYKLAYGTDTVEPEHGKSAGHDESKPAKEAEELNRLRSRIAELEAGLAENPAMERKKD